MPKANTSNLSVGRKLGSLHFSGGMWDTVPRTAAVLVWLRVSSVHLAKPKSDIWKHLLRPFKIHNFANIRRDRWQKFSNKKIYPKISLFIRHHNCSYTMEFKVNFTSIEKHITSRSSILVQTFAVSCSPIRMFCSLRSQCMMEGFRLCRYDIPQDISCAILVLSIHAIQDIPMK